MKTSLTILTLAAAMLTANAGSRAYNLSARGNVGTGDNVMIGGIIVGPPPLDRPCEDGGPDGQGPIMFAVRALAPSLVSAGVPGVLADPAIQFYNESGDLIFTQDSYLEATPAQLAVLAAYGLIPTDPTECAITIALLPGRYTAVVCGEGDAPTGVALLEIYKLSR